MMAAVAPLLDRFRKISVKTECKRRIGYGFYGHGVVMVLSGFQVTGCL